MDLRKVYEGFPDPFAFAKAQVDDSEDGPGLICEMKAYEARFDSRGQQVTLQVGKRRGLHFEGDRDRDSALVLTSYFNAREELDYTELEIRSPHVIAALREVVVEYPGMNLQSQKITIQGLPTCFFHYRGELQEYSIALQDPMATKHVAFALDYMYQTLHNELVSYYHLMLTPSSSPGLEYANLWMVFQPGCLVYTRIGHVDKVYRFKSMAKGPCMTRDCRGSRWILVVERLDYDGINFGYDRESVCIPSYKNYRRIDELPIFPFEYHSNKEAISSALVARGRKFISLQGVHHKYYEGTVKSLSAFRLSTIWGEEDEFPIQSITVGL